MPELKDIKDRPFEERAAEVQRFIDYYSIEGDARLIHPEVLNSVLAELGAHFENIDEEGKRSLAHYSNRGKHVGMEQVWGARRAEFKAWAERWAAGYEISTRRELPGVNFTDRSSKTEGMRQFLGELTAYAAGCIQFSDLAERLRARFVNFGIPKTERIKITVPGYNISRKTGKEKSFAPASFPPEFPRDAWDKIKSWRR